MNMLRNWKKAAAALTAAVMLTGSLTVPVMAHGHGSSHHSSGTYCSYHGTTHRTKSSCSKYCTVHRTTHKNGVRHHSSGHH